MLVAQAAAQPLAKPELYSQRFHPIFDGKLQEMGIPGGAYAIVDADGSVVTRSYGVSAVRGGAPVNDETVFRLASVSKTFAGVLTGMLVADGALAWQDPVTNYVPGFHIRGDTAAITVADLLGHSTGLVSHAYDNLLEEGWEPSAILERFAELEPVCAPGSCYTYQNNAYSLIAPVLAQATGQPYEALVEQRLFRPLGMAQASLGFQRFEQTPNRALPHVRQGRTSWRTVAVKPNYYRLPPAAGVNASINDMAQWLLAQLGTRPEVLDQRVIETVTRPRMETRRDLNRRYWRDVVSDARYGLGWRIYTLGAPGSGNEIVYHSGWVSGYRADLAWSPAQGIGLAVLINAESNVISELSTQFWRMVFDL